MRKLFVLAALAGVLAAGCATSPMLELPASAAVAGSQGERIVGWGGFNLGATYADVKKALNDKGIAVTVAPAGAVDILSYRGKPRAAYLSATVGMEGGASMTVPGYAFDTNLPTDSQMLLLEFDKSRTLQQVGLVLIASKGIKPTDYASDVLVPALDRRYRRGPGRREDGREVLATWHDDARNEVAVMGMAGNGPRPAVLIAMYSTSAYSMQGRAVPVF